jgi:amino acid adenylation domain-containing protein
MEQANPPATISPVAREKDFPLSYAQQRLWFLDKLEPNSPTYNVPGAIRISGRLNVAVIEKCLNEIVRRHEALRTSFTEVQGRPSQVVAPELKTKLEILDLSGFDVGEREGEAMRLAVEEARRPFDITKAPLMRATLLRLSDDDSLLLLTLHHIVSDGWSVGVFLSELTTLYPAFSLGKPSPLAELPIQYGDYAVWQRQYLSGEILERQLSYWKQHLSRDVPTLQLPLDRPRPPVRSSRGARQPMRLPKMLTAALDELSRREGATLFMALAATFNVLLYRYSGQDDILIGSPIANRNRLEVERLIGLFLNMIVLRTDLSGDPSYLELLGRVKGVTLEAFSHQDLPFERLVEELAVERDVNRTLLFQVMFVLQNAPTPPLNIQGLTLSLVDVDWGTAKFDLTLNLSRGKGGISGYIEYNTDLFEAPTIERMAVHFETLLTSAVDDPRQRISQLTLLSEAEREQLLVTWNDTKSGHGGHKCVHHLIEEQAERTPENIAVVFEQEQITYKQLNRRSNQLARYLQSLGVKPESRVGLYTEPSVETIVGLLAVLKAGGAYVPLDTVYPKDRLAMMLEDGQALVLLTQHRLASTLPDYDGTVIYLDRDWDRIARHSPAEISSKVSPENMAYLLYTSGSTGKPKGTMIEHRQLHNYIHAIVNRLAPPAGSGFAVVQPLTFDSCCTVLYPSLCTGGSAHLVSRERAIDPDALGEYFQRHRIKYLKITPSHLESLQAGRHPEKVLPEDWLVFGGETSHWDQVQKIHSIAPTCNILNHYGPTETTVGVLTYKVPKGAPRHHSPSVPIGRPLPNIQAYLLDHGLQPVPTNVVGELHIGGGGLARGYLNRPDLTAERFIPNPFSNEPGSRLFKTGDLARHLPDGNVEFLGRIDHQVKIRGFRVEIGEIESVLENHPHVRNVAVVAREDAPGLKQLVAYVVPHFGHPLAIGELHDYLKTRLPGFMMPSAFVLLDKLPLTHNGKLDRRALPAPDQADLRSSQTIAPPGSPIEKVLVDIWMQVLRIEAVGIHSNFFELGGHSLLVTQVASRISEAFHVDVPIIVMFEKPTIAELAAEVEKRILDRIEELTEEEAQRLLNE